jgi:hypothetical protein
VSTSRLASVSAHSATKGDGTLPRALGERGKTAAARAGAWLLVTAATGLAACGGGQRQDVNEPSGKFPVRVTQARFPVHQKISGRTDLVLGIQNVGNKTLPDLAVTIFTGNTGEPKAQGSFDVRLSDSTLANPSRPVWVLENEWPKLLGNGVTLANVNRAPTAGAAAAQTDTFQFGPLKPDASKLIDWRVTPAMAGTYTVHYEVAAGLQGKAKAVTGHNEPVKGEFVVTISKKVPQTCVTGSGKVVSGRCQLSGGVKK